MKTIDTLGEDFVRKHDWLLGMAKRLGVSLTVVCDIRDGKRWTHLP